MVVLIDCWEDLLLGSISSNIVDFCITNPWIKAVALATYDDSQTNGYLCPTERPWYDNTRKIFYENAKWTEIRKIWKASTFSKKQRSITSPVFVDMPTVTGQMRFQAQHSLFLIHYLNNVDPSIRNVYFLGGGWNKCIQWREVGWWQMASINQSRMLQNKINILTHGKCLYGDETIPEFAPTNRAWSRLDKDIWILNQNKVDFFDILSPNVPKGYA